jgi:DNA-binding transcriptional MocR family regulator
VRLRPAVFDDAAVARFHDALARSGARVAHGDWFGDERRVFRLGFGLPDAAGLQAGLAALGEALQRALAHTPA